MHPGRDKKFGKWGEDQACAFLQRHGFFIVERNYFATVGEIDIVAKQDGDYYFVEVKTRVAGEMASDLAITPTKKHKLEKTIKKYCYQRNVPDTGLILAGLLVVYDRGAKSVSFRLVVME
ncbi:MAG: YraN family protein [Candidatus Magasanikbacteria bacterium]|jgi:putative endonuclease